MSKANISADTDEQSIASQTPKTYPCPQCRKPTPWQDNPYKPFCSDRCKLIDLGAWANEEYRVPAQDNPFSTDLH